MIPFAVAALGVLLAVQAVGRDPRYLAPLAAFTALLMAPAMLGRWRMRRLLISGDVERVILTWEGSIDRRAPRDQVAPLLRATAYAAYGWVQPARTALARAGRAPVSRAAMEQRLFVETLLDTFEGDNVAALAKATALEKLPIAGGGPWTRRRVAVLRRGVAALARAFAHSSTRADARVLSRAASASPLVHWAMRYAAAIAAVDHGRARDVRMLLAGAPSWPEESAFQSFHHELLARAVP